MQHKQFGMVTRWVWSLLILLTLASCGNVPNNAGGNAAAGGNTAAANVAATLAVSALSTPVFSNVQQTSRTAATVLVSSNVTDQYGAPLSGVTVTFKATSAAAASTSTVTAVSAASGTASATLSYDPNNPPTVVASAAAITSAASVSAPHPVGKIVLASPATTGVSADGGVGSYVITAQVLDAYGSPVANEAINFTPAGHQGLVVVTPSSLTTSAGGVVTATVTDISSANDTVNISASAGGVSTAAPLALSFVGTGAGGAGGGANTGNAISLVANLNNLPADGVTSATVTVTVQDATGVAVPNLALTVSSTGSAIVSAPAATNAQGQTTFTITDTIGEVVTISVSDGTSTGSLSQSFIPAVKTLTVTSSATTVLADGTSFATLTISAKDAQGRGVTGEQLAISSNSKTVFVPNTAVTDQIAGQTTVQVSNVTAEPVTITVQSRNGGIRPGVVQSGTSLVTFVPAAVQIGITVVQPALAKTIQTLNIKVTDASGNPQANRTLNLSATGLAILSAYTGTTDATGALLDSTGAAITLTDAVPELTRLTVSDALGTSSASTTVQFLAASAAKLTVTATPKSVLPDAVSTATVTAFVVDVNGAAVSNALVDFYTLAGSSVISASQALTNAQGNAVITISDSVAENIDVYAALPLNGLSAKSTRVAFEQPIGSLSLSSDVTSLSANGKSKVTLKATVLDAAGSPLAKRQITFTNTGAAALNVSSQPTDPYGVATVTLTDAAPETVRVVASIGALSSTKNITFTPLVGFMTMTVQPATAAVAADGLSVATLIVNVKDTYGTPIVGQLVQFFDKTQGGSASQLSASSVLTNASGTATITLTDPYAEAVTVQAKAGTFTPQKKTIKFSLTNLSLLITGKTPFLADAQNHPVTITVTDQNGNVQPNQVLSVKSSSPSMIPSKSSITTDSYGQATLWVRDSVPETPTLTFTDASGALSFGSPIAFVSAQADSLVLTATSKSVIPDGIASSTITALVRDSYGAAVSNAVVDFYTQAVAAVLSQSRVLTDAAGKASITVVDTYAESIDVYGVLSLNPYATLQSDFSTITFEQAVGSLSLVTDKASLSVDTYASLSATVLDSTGAPLSNRSVSFTTTGSAVMKTTASNTQVVKTNASGVATIALTDAVSETVNIVASINGQTQTQSVNFIPVVGSLNVTLQPGNASVAADGTSVGTILVNVKDSYGVPIAGQLVNFSDITKNPYASSARLSATSAITDASGAAQITVTDPVAESVKLQISAGAKTLPATINFVLTQVSLIAHVKAPFLADGQPNAVTVTVTDAQGVAQPNYLLTVDSSSMTLLQSDTYTAVNGAGVTVLPQSNPVNITTDAYGQATVYVRDSVPESVSLIFKSATGTASFGVPVLFVASTAQNVSLSTPTSTATPDGVSPVTVTALVRDAYGVAVPNAIIDFYTQSGRATILSPTYGAGNTNTGTQGNAASPDFLGFAGRASTQGVKGLRALTDATGRFSISIVDTYAESIDVYAALSLNPYANTTPVFSTLTFEQPVQTLSLVSDVSSLSATTGTATLKATVLDANGGVLPGRVVHFTSTGTGTFNVSNKTTDPYGVATVTLTDTTAETVNVVATIGALSSTQSITFTPVVKSLNVTIQPSNAAIAADGTSVGTILVNVKDSAGAPISGQVVQLTDPYGSSAQLSAASIITDVNGTKQVTIKDPYAEQVTIQVTAGGVTKSVVLNFLQTQLSLAISASAPFLADGKGNSVTITATDANGAALANRVFSVSSTGSMQTSASSVTTNALGNATVPLTVSDTISETASLIFTDATGQLSFSQSIQFVAATADQITLTATPSSVVPDGVATATLNAVVRDVYGVAVSNAVVDFYTSGVTTTAVLSQSRVLTDALGRASVTVSNTTAQTSTINARLTLNSTAAKPAVSTPVVFEKAVGSLTLVTDKTSLSAGGIALASLTATVLDSTGAPLNKRTVSFTTTGSSVLTGTPATTNASGVATVTLTDAYAETVSVVANINGLTKTQSITFTPVPSSVKIAQVPVVGNVVADGTQAFTLKVKVLDANNKAITGQLIDVYAQSAKGGFVTVTPTQASSDPVTGILTVTVSDMYATSDTVTLWASAGTGAGLTSQFINLAFVGSAPNQPALISIQTDKARVLTDGVDKATLTAVVQDVNGAAVQNALVSFSSNAGLLSAATKMTDVNGQAVVTLASAATRLNSVADVYASVAGIPQNAVIPIQFTGTTLSLSSTRTTLDVYAAAVDTLVATVTDAANNPVYHVPVNITSAKLGALKFVDAYTNTVDLYTDVNGQVQVDVYGGAATIANVTPVNTTAIVTSGGSQASQVYSVSGTPSFAITAPLLSAGSSVYSMVNVDALGAAVPLQLDVSYATPNAKVVFTTSLGTLLDVAPPGVAMLSGASIKVTASAGGVATAYLTSNAAGIATVQVYEQATPSTSDTMKVSLALPASSAKMVTLQAASNSVLPSSGSTTPNTVTLTATAWDGVGMGRQAVANVPIQFALSGTIGGGEYITPSLAITDASGVAKATFASGSLPSGSKGVGIVANISGLTVPTSANKSFTYNPGVAGGSPTITRVAGNFITDGFNTNTIGLPFVIQVQGTTKNDGAYRVVGVTATALTLDTTESLVAETVVSTISQAGALSHIVVGGTAGSVAIGLGTTITIGGSTSYIQPMSVLLSDAAGAAIPNAQVSLKVEPIRYIIGEWYDIDPTIGSTCIAYPVKSYTNEDLNKNFILDPGEDIQATAALAWFNAGIDIYGNLLAGTTSVSVGPDLQLTPRQSDAGSLPTSVTTGANGVGNFDLTYLKQFANWLEVRVTATYAVGGTETSSFRDFVLPAEVGEASGCVLPDSPYNVGVKDALGNQPPFLGRALIGQ